ncbi:MAG: peptidoglycan binding domain-containing protein [Lachnospiraceae bacterium]|nr:peptidoglycan binding domain-containing protein [Lachnospiraceae bacterium]
MLDPEKKKGSRTFEDRLLTPDDVPGPGDDDIEIPDGDDDLTEQVSAHEETEEERQAAAKSMRNGRAAKIAAAFAVICVIAVSVLFAVNIHYTDYYTNHFYDGTTINGMDVSRLTVDVVKKRIRDDIGTYQLAVKLKDDREEVLTSKDVGWSYVDDGAVEELMNDQDAGHWYKHILSGDKSHSVSAGTTYDRKKAQEAIRSMEAVSGRSVVKPQNAVLKLKTDGTYTVTEEVEGNRLDIKKTEKAILGALDESKTEVDLTDPDCYMHPTVFSDDEALCRRRDQWNHLLGIRLKYQFGDSYEEIDRNFLLPYITDDGQNVTLSTDWVHDLVYAWGLKYDTFGVAIPFKTHDGTTITVEEGGDYGWCIDKDATEEELLAAVENGESGVREPVWLYEANGWDNGGLTGTYVEVSIADQMLWCYKDYELVMETDVVTGLPVPSRETHRGIYAVDAKKSPATLGSLDVQGYASPVSWWCPFNGGQGLHDAPWRSEFGGGIYQSNGSHGCVNIPVDCMEVIYDTVVTGTAVVVY